MRCVAWCCIHHTRIAPAMSTNATAFPQRLVPLELPAYGIDYFGSATANLETSQTSVHS